MYCARKICFRGFGGSGGNFLNNIPISRERPVIFLGLFFSAFATRMFLGWAVKGFFSMCDFSESLFTSVSLKGRLRDVGISYE